jgi:hypothetical protein
MDVLAAAGRRAAACSWGVRVQCATSLAWCGSLLTVLTSTGAAADEVVATDESPAGSATSALSAPVAPKLLDCTLFPMSACRLSLVFEAGFGVGVANFGEDSGELRERSRFVGRAFTTAGFVAQPLPDSNVHLGPLLEWAVEPADTRTSWTLSPNLRVRWFPLAGHPGRAFVVEAALGPQLQHFWYPEPFEALRAGTRFGAMTEIAFGWRGMIGPWTQLAVLEDPFDDHGRELRFFGGMRFNFGIVLFAAERSGLVRPIPPPRP